MKVFTGLFELIAAVGLTTGGASDVQELVSEFDSLLAEVTSGSLKSDAASTNLTSISPGFRPVVAGDPSPIDGFYDVAYMKYKNPLMDITNQHITVFFPVNYDADETPEFRFLAYSHGYMGGGVQTGPCYYEMCKALASFG